MTEHTTTQPMAAQLEDSITKYFYSKDAAVERQKCYAVGLQTPLWLWTHEEAPQSPSPAVAARGLAHKAEHESKDLRKVCHLMEWILRNQVDLSRVLVMVPLSARELFKTELTQTLSRWLAEQQPHHHHHHHGQLPGSQEGEGRPSSSLQGSNATTPLPVVLAHHELTAMNRRDKTHYTFDVVVYVLGVRPNATSLPSAMAQEEFISEALRAAGRAFVMLADSGWAAPCFTAKWTQWRNFLSKLQEEEAPISMVGADTTQDPAKLPSLVGASLPLCCAVHPNQRQLAYGLTTITGECKRLCLRHYDCGVETHLCRDACHPNRRHAACPFACSRPLPCGHGCLLSCSARCNCFEVIEKPLPCSHQVVLGLDPDSLEPIFGTVQHVFRGVCGDADLPCAVEFPTECARCLGPMTVKCFEAQQHGHSIQQRTLLCDACKRTERELRAKILGEVLYGTEAEKKKLKVELQRALHQQRKAAAQGLFTPGVKVEITDATKCVPPLLADEDFPGVVFVDMDDPSFYASMEGAYGTFISSHVDVMDRSELRNLVRLPDGKHVLVTDGGLRMIRAVTSGVTGAAVGPALMLTAKPHHPNDNGRDDDGAVASGGGNAPEFDKAKAMVGSTYYLSEPVPCAECAGGMISDKAVVVAAIDPSSADNVMVECRIARRRQEAADLAEAVDPLAKRARTEAEAEASTTAGAGHEMATLRFSVPISALEPMRGYEKGQYVYVVNPARQVRDPHIIADLQPAVAALLASRPGDAGPITTGPVAARPAMRLTSVPVNPDVAYELLGIVNPPLWLGRGTSGADSSADEEDGDAGTAGPASASARLGPCAVLRARATHTVVAAARPHAARRGRDVGRPVSAPRPALPTRAPAPLAERPLVAIPFMFTTPDELTEAENALDTAAQQRFEERLREAITAHSEELSLRNDEEAFHAQQRMGPVTEERRAEVRTAYSTPVPLPTPEQVAAVRRRHVQLPTATPITAKVANAKDVLAAKAEAKDVAAWVEEMQARVKRDREVADLHIRDVQAEQQRAPPQHTAKRNPQPPPPSRGHNFRHRR